VTRDYRVGLPSLDYARVSPTVLRLATGEIFVAGGRDDHDNVVPFVERFSRDAGRHLRTRGLVGTANQGFVPLEGGGVLAVIAQQANNVWVISREGDIASAPPIPPPLTEVRLFPGSAGAPILWTGDRWLRWEPWRGEFVPTPTLTLTKVGPETDAIVAPDGGLAAWISRDPSNDRTVVFGLRFDTRSAYTTDSAEGALLVSDTSKFAPDRLTTPGDTTLAFDVTRGLVLAAGASAYLTDATFASFTLDLDITGGAPIVVLRQASGSNYGIELEIGGVTSCPLLAPDGTKALHITRNTAGEVKVAFDQGQARACPTLLPPDVRVSVGLRGVGDNASAKNFVITRL
jgi:hypothetical protein